MNELKRQISINEFQLETGIDDEKVWRKSQQAKSLMEETMSRELDKKIFTKQGKRLEAEGNKPEKSLRRAFIKLFTTSSLGLKIKDTGVGDRPSEDQSNFRAGLLEVTKQHFEQDSEACWCPIAGSNYPLAFITAAHLFAWTHGQETMTAIFGEESSSELFSPLNGLLISSTAEKFLEKGYIVIVPRLSAQPPDDEVQAWQRSEPKEYQIRVLEVGGDGMRKKIFGREDGCTWAELDGQPLLFKSDFRPRARYLYFIYCTTILRRSWAPQHRKSALSDELGKPYWGSRGRFMKKGMLLAFVEEMGHEYEGLLDGAIEDGSTTVESDASALFAANQQILSSVREKDESDDEDESDDDDDEDDDEKGSAAK